MTRRSILAILLVLSVWTPSWAQDRATRAVYEAAATISTGIPRVNTFPELPTGFDAARASPTSLAKYGLPPRPADPVMLAEWVTAMSAHPRKSTEKIRTMPFRSKPAKIISSSGEMARDGSATASSANWSGGVTLLNVLSYGSGSIKLVAGEFNVPLAQPAFGSTYGGDASGWVGIDGWADQVVLQGGWDISTGGTRCAWFEFYPSSMNCVFNVNVGDILFIEVWNTSAIQGYVYLQDKTQNFYQTVTLGTTCSACVLIGNSAEYIIERPWGGFSFTPLVNYVTGLMGLGVAETFSGQIYGPGSRKPPFQVNVSMYEPNQSGSTEMVSSAISSGTRGLVFNAQGCALTGGC